MHTRESVARSAQPKNNAAQLIDAFRTAVAPNWTPLEKLLPPHQVRRRGPRRQRSTSLGCEDFMFMGTVVGVFLYKNRDTRAYLNLDAAGNAYRFNPDTSNYDPIPVAQALQEVQR
jgi:hypothetical protein